MVTVLINSAALNSALSVRKLFNANFSTFSESTKRLLERLKLRNLNREPSEKPNGAPKLRSKRASH